MGSVILLSHDDESTLSLYKVIHTRNRLKWDDERYKEEYSDNIKKFDVSTGQIYGYQDLISNYKMYIKETFVKFQQLFVKET
jgi:ACT domain-containing protein